MPQQPVTADPADPATNPVEWAELAALTDAYRAAADSIGAAPTPDAEFQRATALAAELRRVADDAAELRARAAARIWATEEMSLAGLAQRIGVSKARAGQFINTAKKDRQP